MSHATTIVLLDDIWRVAIQRRIFFFFLRKRITIQVELIQNNKAKFLLLGNNWDVLELSNIFGPQSYRLWASV